MELSWKWGWYGGRFSMILFALEKAIGSHTYSLEANMRVTNGIPLGCPRHLTVTAVNSVTKLKVVTFSAHQAVLTTSKNFFGGLTGTLEHGTDSEVVAWSNGANWTRACSNFAGRWCDYKSCPVGTSQEFSQTGCAGTVTIGGKVSFTYTVTGNVLTASKGFYNGLAGTLDLTSVGPDLLQWANGADWYRNHTSGAFRQPYM